MCLLSRVYLRKKKGNSGWNSKKRQLFFQRAALRIHFDYIIR